jgi:general stress protein YciG
MASSDNPGNFAHRPKEEVQAAAKKGGENSHSGGFASMDPDKQVCWPLSLPLSLSLSLPLSFPLVLPYPSHFTIHVSDRMGEYERMVDKDRGGNSRENSWTGLMHTKEITSKGGQASSGSFEKGSEAAREAGRKGGLST